MLAVPSLTSARLSVLYLLLKVRDHKASLSYAPLYSSAQSILEEYPRPVLLSLPNASTL